MSTITFYCQWCGQSLEAEDDMAGDVIDCPSCNRRIKIPILTARSGLGLKNASPRLPDISAAGEQGQHKRKLGVMDFVKPRDSQHSQAKAPPPAAPSRSKLQLQKSSSQSSRPVSPAPQPYAAASPPPQQQPQQRQVAFVCPHCGINVTGIASPGETVQCLTCGGAVIVPADIGKQPSALDGVQMLVKQLAVWAALGFVVWYMYGILTDSPKDKHESNPSYINGYNQALYSAPLAHRFSEGVITEEQNLDAMRIKFFEKLQQEATTEGWTADSSAFDRGWRDGDKEWRKVNYLPPR